MSNASHARSMRGSISAHLGSLLIVAALAAFGAWLWMDDKVEAAEKKATAAEQTLKDERETRKKVDKNAEKVAARLAAQKRKSDALEKQLEHALENSPDCSLSADVGGVLRDVVPGATSAAGGPEVRAEPADPAGANRAGDRVEVEGRAVSCKAVAEWATRNIAICQADAPRFQGVIDQYEIVRRRSDHQ